MWIEHRNNGGNGRADITACRTEPYPAIPGYRLTIIHTTLIALDDVVTALSPHISPLE